MANIPTVAVKKRQHARLSMMHTSKLIASYHKISFVLVQVDSGHTCLIGLQSPFGNVNALLGPQRLVMS